MQYLRIIVMTLSIVGCSFIIGTILLSNYAIQLARRGQNFALRLILWQSMSVLIVQVSAITITNRSNEVNKDACKLQAYLIHAFWVASFSISMVTSYSVYIILNGSYGRIKTYSLIPHMEEPYAPHSGLIHVWRPVRAVAHCLLWTDWLA